MAVIEAPLPGWQVMMWVLSAERFSSSSARAATNRWLVPRKPPTMPRPRLAREGMLHTSYFSEELPQLMTRILRSGACSPMKTSGSLNRFPSFLAEMGELW